MVRFEGRQLSVLHRPNLALLPFLDRLDLREHPINEVWEIAKDVYRMFPSHGHFTGKGQVVTTKDPGPGHQTTASDRS